MQWKYKVVTVGGVPREVETPIIIALGPAGTQLTDQQLSDSAAEEMKAGNYEAARRSIGRTARPLLLRQRC